MYTCHQYILGLTKKLNIHVLQMFSSSQLQLLITLFQGIVTVIDNTIYSRALLHVIKLYRVPGTVQVKFLYLSSLQSTIQSSLLYFDTYMYVYITLQQLSSAHLPSRNNTQNNHCCAMGFDILKYIANIKQIFVIIVIVKEKELLYNDIQIYFFFNSSFDLSITSRVFAKALEIIFNNLKIEKINTVLIYITECVHWSHALCTVKRVL